MEKLNIGIIGCGRIADLHYPGYKNSKEARIYAVCDTNPETAAMRKRQWKAEKSFTDYRELLADPGIDAVEILTPTMLHEKHTLDALGSGKHVAVQKPIANTLEEAGTMIRAASSAGKILKVSDNYVFYPPIILAKKMIESGEIGTPTNLRIKLISGKGGWDVPAASWEWRIKEASQGRGLQTFDHGHHLWALSWYLLGDSERVMSWIDSADGVVDSPAVIMWKYARGKCYGMCEYSYETELSIPSKYYGNDEWIEITGTRGLIMINRCTGLLKKEPVVSLYTNKGWKHYSSGKSLPADWADGFIGSTKNFIAALAGREKPFLSADEGMYVLKFALAIQKSARERRELYLDEVNGKLSRFRAGRKRKAEMRDYPFAPKKKSIFGGEGKLSALAPQAKELTEKLMERFNPEAVKGWETVIGLNLLADGGTPDQTFGLFVKGGKAELRYGQIPAGAALIIKIPAGTWAGILLGKKKLEMALIQGKLKIEGKAEEALKLRAAVGI